MNSVVRAWNSMDAMTRHDIRFFAFMAIAVVLLYFKILLQGGGVGLPVLAGIFIGMSLMPS